MSINMALYQLLSDTIKPWLNAVVYNFKSYGTYTAVGDINVEKNINVNTVNSKFLIGDTSKIELGTNKTFVTQATNISTAVTSNKISGSIITQAAATIPGARDGFTVNCSPCLGYPYQGVLLTLNEYSGTTGCPIVMVGTVSPGSFTIIILNTGTANLNGQFQISYQLV